MFVSQFSGNRYNTNLAWGQMAEGSLPQTYQVGSRDYTAPYLMCIESTAAGAQWQNHEADHSLLSTAKFTNA